MNKLPQSAALYRGAAGAEFFAAILYMIFALFATAGAAMTWGMIYFPFCVIGALVCGRMAGAHWRERGDLLDTAKQIEENEQTES